RNEFGYAAGHNAFLASGRRCGGAVRERSLSSDRRFDEWLAHPALGVPAHTPRRSTLAGGPGIGWRPCGNLTPIHAGTRLLRRRWRYGRRRQLPWQFWLWRGALAI